MSKKLNPISTDLSPPILYGFYRPHARVQEHGFITNHVTGEVTRPPSMTKQDFKDQCDINNILKAFKLTGQVNHISSKAAQGAFLDLPDQMDFQAAIGLVERAEASFMALPAAIRDRFGSRPADFLAFVANPANADELVRLGIREQPRQAPGAAPTAPGGAGGTPPAPTPPSPPGAAPGGSQPPSSGQT